MVDDGDPAMNLGLFAALDDEALAALSSKGLVRRARKDLERDAPEVREQGPDTLALVFAADDCTVTMPATGPAQATCTCPADGCCRHILAAALFLRTRAGETADTAPRAASAADEILALSEDDLVAWAGRSIYRQALDDLASGEVEVAIEEEERGVVCRFPALGVVTRWIGGAGREGTICSCKRECACWHRIAAVLVFHARHGRPLPTLPRTARRAAPGAPRSRAAVLEAVQTVIADVVVLGLGRLSTTVEERLATLAVSAHGVDLPYLERLLRALGHHVGWSIGRDVRANTGALLYAAARTHALASALAGCAEPLPVRLAGEHRSHYLDVGGLDLIGLGAQQWRTRSGYAGLSLFFWDTAARRWATWSDSRPTFHEAVRFDPRGRYEREPVWEGTPAARDVSRSRVRVGAARRNRAGRLSSHAGCQAFVTGAADPASVDLEGVRFADWYDLAARVAAARASGLAERAPLDDLVVLVPAGWDAPTYIQTRQAVLCPVRDAAGRRLSVVLRYDTAWPFAVETLQRWQPERWETWGVLGHVRIVETGLELAPIALYNRTVLPAPISSHILNLTLDPWQAPAPGEAPAGEPAPAGEAEPAQVDEVPDDTNLDEVPHDANEADDNDDWSAARAGSGVGGVLRAAALDLEELAERGVRAAGVAGEERLRELSERLGGVGVAVCARALARLAAHVAADRHRAAPEPRGAAVALLQSYYVVRLALEQLQVAATLAALRREAANAGGR
jgi:SWIM zinc finger